MDEAFKKQAEEWFERGRHDIETAHLLLEHRGHTDSIAGHIQQALEKYLKGCLVLCGERPPKIHELDTLLNRVMAFDSALSEFLDLCEKASRYYVENRYPPGPVAEYGYAELQTDLDKARKLIEKIRARADN